MEISELGGMEEGFEKQEKLDTLYFICDFFSWVSSITVCVVEHFENNWEHIPKTLDCI